MISSINDKIAIAQGPVTIGIVNTPKGPILIDTGIDNSAINKVLKRIEEKPIAAFITHHHADHMGGVSKLNSLNINQIFVPPREIPLFTDTLLEPLIFCGFHPPKQLTNRHLMAKPAKEVMPITEHPFHQITPISTPGHSIDHFSLLVDKSLFCGDAMFNNETIEKHKLLFASNPEEAKNSVAKISKLDIDFLVLGHGGVINDQHEIKDTIKINIEHYQTMEELILGTVPEKGGQVHEIVDLVIKSLPLKTETLTQYILYRHTILGYLSNLLTKEQLNAVGAHLVPS